MNTFPQLSFTCPMKWDELRGDERGRFCDKCQKTVHNLSRMTETERATLLATAEPGQLCVAYDQRVSSLPPAPMAATRGSVSRTLLKAGGAAAFLATVAGLASQASRDPSASLPARAALADAFYTVRYQAEAWIDDVRVFFGGEPRYGNMVLGALMCVPPSAVEPPAPDPGSTPVLPEAAGSDRLDK